MKVNVLGTEYEVVMRPESEHDPKLGDASGYCELHSKKLVVKDVIPDEHTIEKPDDFKKKVLRHELTHAFLHESGIRGCSWGDDEEIVDWIALQGPKIYKAWVEAGAV